jgi:GxxExxY protein
MTKKHVNEITFNIIGAAIEVHRNLGPGLLENVYEHCLLHELKLRGYRVEQQQKIPILYKEATIESMMRYDLLVEDFVVVELKAVETMNPIHEAQLMTYMRLMEKPKGVLLNFFCTNIFREGQKTFVNEHFRLLPDE